MEPHYKKMVRWGGNREGRFVTFSCHERLPLLGSARLRDEFVKALAAAKARCGFALWAWVVMPEHAHLLMTPRDRAWSVEKILVAIKQPVAQVALNQWKRLGANVLDRLQVREGEDGPPRFRFWQAGGGFDRLIRSEEEFFRELVYCHENPVKRGLVEKRTDWVWSSARWFESGEDVRVPMDDARRHGHHRATDPSAGQCS